MAQICPRCGGMEVGCPVCELPPKRKLPKQNKIMAALYKIFAAQIWEVQGIDISAWNGIMDFSITKKKCQFAIVRLGYGNEWKDARCDTYRRDLIANDIPYGVYWYTKPGQDWVMHAEHFAEVASEFPYQLNTEEDFEQTFLDKIGTLNWIINFDTKLKTLVSGKTSPYSSAGFWNSSVAINNYFTDEQWIANWTTAPSPWVPWNWQWKRGCKWQHSADGNRKAKEYGMISNGDVDMDLVRWYGTVNEFNIRYGTHIQPLTPLTPIVPIIPKKYVYINTDALNMRSTPEVTPTNDIGTLKSGDDVPVIEEKNGWYRIEGWISSFYTRPK